MKKNIFEPNNFFKTACFFEGSLVIVALFLGWLTDIDPFANLYFSESSVAVGFLATLPLVIMLFAFQNLPYPPLQKIRSLLLDTLGPNLYRQHWTDLLILASIAGFSEEVLFRGFLQPWLENASNMMAGLLASNLVFALVHAVTPFYAVLAMLIGLYLGKFLDYETERNLLIPIVIHTVYDFVAFIVIMRNYRDRL